VDNLEKQKLVKRMPSKTDRRINLVCLTDAARELQDRTLDIANETMNEALQDITKEEIDTVKQVLQKVYDNLA
jgi:DNA-binding MarR family transcriptional regulator